MTDTDTSTVPEAEDTNATPVPELTPTERLTVIATERRHREELVLKWNAWKAQQGGLDLRDFKVHRPNLRDLDLSDCNLEGATLTEALCNRTNFTAANLKTVAMRGSDCCDARFDQAQLAGADLRWCRRINETSLAAAMGDAETRLPVGVNKPASW